MKLYTKILTSLKRKHYNNREIKIEKEKYMRVIAGKARRLPLKTVAGMDTRPTTDRIKETLFNMLQNDLEGCRFLDLFGGSGGIGIEALSRGAGEAVFVESDRKAAACISDNLKFTKLEKDARVLCCDVLTALIKLESEQPFDLIVMDPPYNKNLEEQVLDYLKDSALANEDTLVIVEASLNTSFAYAEEMGFEVIKRKKYKTTEHVFLKKKSTQRGN